MGEPFSYLSSGCSPENESWRDALALYSQGGLAMLVLTRKEGERIVVADRIVVAVLRVGGNRIRLGIEAPKDVLIRRSELKGSGANTT